MIGKLIMSFCCASHGHLAPSHNPCLQRNVSSVVNVYGDERPKE